MQSYRLLALGRSGREQRLIAYAACIVMIKKDVVVSVRIKLYIV